MKFQLPFFALLAGVAAQSVILDDLNQRVSPQVTKLANDVDEFPKSGLDGALAIDLDSKELASTLDSATGNARNKGSFSRNDGLAILADLSPVVQTLNGLLEGLSAKKDDFNALVLPTNSLILLDLQKLNQSAVGYTDALVEDAPVDQVTGFIAVRNAVASAFAQTLADYEE